MSTRLRITFVLAALAGCSPFANRDLMLEVAARTQAQARANGIRSLANKHTEMFAIADHTWLCADERAALAASRCDGGFEVQKNHNVTVVGMAASNGVWPVSRWDANGEHKLFVAATALRELPDTAALDSFAADLDTRYPIAKRVPTHAFNFADLLEHPADYRGRYLVFRSPSVVISEQEFVDGMVRFTLPIPAGAGSRLMASAQFEMRNRAQVDAFEKSARKYQCGADYCDKFVIVATLTGKTVDRADELGKVHRLPVFSVLELGDRYGTYKPR